MDTQAIEAEEWIQKMNEENPTSFITYRNQLIAFLKQAEKDGANAPKLCVSALNELKTEGPYSYTIQAHRKVSCEEFPVCAEVG